MKRKLLLLFGLASCAIQLNAQTVNTTFASQINTVFANLDKTKVPHKILLDYGLEFTDLNAYSGSLTSENFIDRGNFMEIYNTLAMSRVQTTVSGLISPAIVNTNWENLRQKNKIVLSGLYFKYSKFKINAAPTWVTVSNNKLYDKFVNGVWQNPYEEKQVFAIGIPLHKYNSLSVQVELPTSLWYTNQVGQVQSLVVDFGDGQGYQSVAFDQIKNITYGTSGLKEWKFKITLAGGQILYSHSKIMIDGPASAPISGELERTVNQPCQVDIRGVDKVEFTGTRQYLGMANSAILEIDYAETNGCGQIRKPLIVVEGFDSGLLAVENELGENSYQRFITDSQLGTAMLPAQIQSYDVIYVNWSKGRDYMQRNAYLLQDIIKWVNQQKANAGSSFPNVVLGQSMGGVIARYALRDMENLVTEGGPNANAWNHQTSLYISHDAPHQGANIPLSVLYFARHMADQFISTPAGGMNLNPNTGSVSIEKIQALLDSPGTKQLLKTYVNSSLTIDNEVGNGWRTELATMGYPQSTRNISISNGNHCGQQQSLAPGGTIFSLNGNAKTGLATDFLSMILAPLFGDATFALAHEFEEPALLLNLLPGSTKLNLNFLAKALPNPGTTAEIYKGKISITKKLFWLFELTVIIMDRSVPNPSGSLPVDSYPGGSHNLFNDFPNSNVETWLGTKNITAFVADSFNFIPTTSSLDVGKGDVTLVNNDYIKKYTATAPPASPKEIPFHNFTTSHNSTAKNEKHISFNLANSNWLILELDGELNNEIAFNCLDYCANEPIVGSDYLCGTTTYSVAPDAAFTSWSITEGANLVTQVTNGNQITLTPLLLPLQVMLQ